MTAVIVVLAVLLLAYANGANDNFKGVATLFGSGTTHYRGALLWATVTTLAGSLLALTLARGLTGVFSGQGLVPTEVTLEPAFVLAVGAAACITILIATLAGFPISTTHALVGGLAGAGWLATRGRLDWGAVTAAFVLPLAASPLLSMALARAIAPLLSKASRAMGLTPESCLCVDVDTVRVRPSPHGAMAYIESGIELTAGTREECARTNRGRLLGLNAPTIVDVLHYTSAGAVGFARGLNDTPKIGALLLTSSVLAPASGLVIVAGAMALGGLLSAGQVARTMSHKITTMTPAQGLAANLVTSVLVILASRYALPVSTTHVSVGALFGLGTVTGTLQRGVIASILIAWVVTLPVSASIAAALYWVLLRT
jgi:PiT family inorganic phosphate transporter